MSTTLSPKTPKPILRRDAALRRSGGVGVGFEVDRQAADTINNVGGNQYNEHRYEMVIEPMRRRARVLLRLGNTLFLSALAAQLAVMLLFGSKIADFVDSVGPAFEAKSTDALATLPFALLLVIPAAAVVGLVGLMCILASLSMRRRARREVEALSTTFNIGSQQAGAIYQAGGDQTIQHGGGTLSVEAIDAAADLRMALDATPMPEPSRVEAEQALEAVETELQAPLPDKGAVAEGVERLAEVLGQAGALASAGEALVSPLRSIASFAGAAGAAALRLLV